MIGFRLPLALIAALALDAAPLTAEEPVAPPPAPPANSDPAAKKPQSLEEIIAGIPAADLDEGVLLEAGAIKVYLSAVEPVEKAYSAARKRRDTKWEFGPGERSSMRRQIGVKLLADKVREAYVAEHKLVLPEKKYAEVFAKFKEAKAKHGGYEQFLTDNGMSDDDLQRALKATVAIESALTAAIGDDEVTAALQAHGDELPLRRASDIMFAFKGADGAPQQVQRSQDEARKLAGELLKKLRESGGDFEKMARETSESPSADRGGDLGFVPKKGGMVDSITDAMYKLEKVGDYAGVVESPFGFHVIKLTGIRPAAELKGDVKDQLVSEKFGAELQKMMDQTVAKARFNEKAVGSKQ